MVLLGFIHCNPLSHSRQNGLGPIGRERRLGSFGADDEDRQSDNHKMRLDENLNRKKRTQQRAPQSTTFVVERTGGGVGDLKNASASRNTRAKRIKGPLALKVP